MDWSKELVDYIARDKLSLPRIIRPYRDLNWPEKRLQRGYFYARTRSQIADSTEEIASGKGYRLVRRPKIASSVRSLDISPIKRDNGTLSRLRLEDRLRLVSTKISLVPHGEAWGRGWRRCGEREECRLEGEKGPYGLERYRLSPKNKRKRLEISLCLPIERHEPSDLSASFSSPKARKPSFLPHLTSCHPLC